MRCDICGKQLDVRKQGLCVASTGDALCRSCFSKLIREIKRRKREGNGRNKE